MKEIQAELDSFIGEKKNLEMEKYKEERITALQVEFNELLNELPFIFKYWSSKYTDKDAINWDKVLEEYVDGLHFIISIANDLEIETFEYQAPVVYDMRKLARGINNMISRLNKRSFAEMFNHFILFGEKLGFTKEQVEKAYMKKYEKNFARQEQGY